MSTEKLTQRIQNTLKLASLLGTLQMMGAVNDLNIRAAIDTASEEFSRDVPRQVPAAQYTCNGTLVTFFDSDRLTDEQISLLAESNCGKTKTPGVQYLQLDESLMIQSKSVYFS